MNYVLSQKAARWLEAQMAKSASYQPATAAPSRLVRRDTAGGGGGSPAFHFKFSHTATTSGGQTTHTYTIGEGAVQIGGYTYFVAEGNLATNISSGTFYVCVKVTLASGTGAFVAYSSTSALRTAQGDQSYCIMPLYKTVNGAVALDYRPLPNAGSWEIAESVGGSS